MSDFKALKSARTQRMTAASYVSQRNAGDARDVMVSETAQVQQTDILQPDDEVQPGTGVSTSGKDEVPTAGEGQVLLQHITSSSLSSQMEPILASSSAKGQTVEGLYKTIPSSLQIRTSDDRGRGLFSTVTYKPGDILFSVKPHVAALSLSHLDSYCSSCFGAGNGTDLKRCTACKIVMYCSSACQSKDWSFHKNECNALKEWFKAAAAESSSSPGEVRPPSDAIRALGRILWKRHKLGPSHLWTRGFDNMQSHRSALSKDAGSFNSEIHTHLAHGVVGYLGFTNPTQLEPYAIHSAADLVDLVSRFTTNTFTVTTPTLSPLGACVAPSVALINHSCDPNAVIVFPRAGGEAAKDQEPLLQVIALKYIQQGDEVLTSYIDTTLPRELRQKALKETYHFTCKCSLCSPPSGAPVDMREAMWCPKRCGGLCCLPTEQDSFTRCTKCGAVVKDTDAVLDALRIGQEALEKAERVQDSDPKKALQLTENLSQILVSAGSVPGAHPLLALSRLHSSLLIGNLSSAGDDLDIEQVFSPQLQQTNPQTTPDAKQKQEEAQQALDEAIRSATRANTGLNQVLTYGHPVRGVSLAELGKLLAVDEPSPKDVENGADLSPESSATPTAHPAQNTLSRYPPSGPKRLKLAYDTLVRARVELVIGFGGGRSEGGEVGKEVRRQIVDVEKELGVWKEGVRNAWEGLSEEHRKKKVLSGGDGK